MKIENANELRLVAYTDGSANPNPGVVGSGVHGYAYKEYSDTPIEEFDNIYTDKGYIVGVNSEIDTKNVKPEYLIDLYQSFSFAESNNYAEINAVCILLDWIYLNEYNFKSVLIYSDSAYVVNGITKWLPKWEDDDFKDRSSSASWKNISDKLKKLKERNVEIEIVWIKGHKGHLGNELADAIANVGRQQGLRGNYEFSETVVSSKDYFSNKTDIHPLLSFNHLIMATVRPKNNNDKHLYYQYHTSLPEHQIGKASSLCSYSVVMLNEPVKAIQNIENIVYKNSLYRSINLVKLDKIKSKDYYRRIVNFPETSIFNRRMNNSFIFWENTTISPEINPPGLLLNVLETYDVLLEMLQEELHSGPNNRPYTLINITDHFYDNGLVESKKKSKDGTTSMPVVKTTLKEDMKVGYNQKTLEIEVYKDKKFVFPLLLGMDLPDRNALKRIESLNPSIDLLIFPSDDHETVLSYAIMITTTDAIGIWAYYPSNKVYRLK